MDSGFTREQFDLLRDHAGRPAENGPSGHVYAVLKDAHYATRDWADDLQAAHFPMGRVEARRAPINQGGNYTPYTWAKIYPRPDAPKVLAYTVGIDAVGAFIVKIDTVNGGGALQTKFEAVRGPTNDGAPIAAVMDVATGLTMSREDLVSWSAKAISGFSPTYDELVQMLDLGGPLRLITEPDAARTAAADWRRAMTDGVVRRGATRWVPDGEIVLKAPKVEEDRTTLTMGVLPKGTGWTVGIADPLEPGSQNPLSNFATDSTGRRYLVHQARLGSNTKNILETEFLAVTGLTPVDVEVPDEGLARKWVIVADLDADPVQIRRSTGRFVHLCALVRAARASASQAAEQGNESVPSKTDADWVVRIAPDEVGGTYVIAPRPALDERLVIKRHGLVSMTLHDHLAKIDVTMRKLQHPLGFQIDGEILRQDSKPLLIEIKTSISAADVHTGVGQLLLYSRLIPGLDQHVKVLLLPKMPAAQVVDAIAATGIVVHTYTLTDTAEGGEAVFSNAFLTLCTAG